MLNGNCENKLYACEGGGRKDKIVRKIFSCEIMPVLWENRENKKKKIHWLKEFFCFLCEWEQR